MRLLMFLAALVLPISGLTAQETSDHARTPGVPGPQSAVSDQTLLETVGKALSEAAAGTRFGLLVERLDGTPILAVAPDQRFIPASNTKIFTTVAAYAQLAELQAAAMGTGVRIEPASAGAVDVILEGRGDAELSAMPDCVRNCLATLADAVAARTKTVRDIVGDDSWYPDERWSPGMSWNNIPYRSGAGISALSIDHNETSIEVSAVRGESSPRVSGDGYYQIANRAIVVAGDRADVGIWRMPGSSIIELSGSIGIDAEPSTLRMAIDDPAHQAAWHLRRMLEARGVEVSGEVRARHRPLVAADNPSGRGEAPAARPPEETMLARLEPQDLAEDIELINKVSQNVHAELMLRRVGSLEGTGSIADGQAAVAKVTEQGGISENGYILADGSGMSSYNRITPRATVALLRWVAMQPWGEDWRATLPVGGVDGTLSSRFAGTALEGKVFAKTGSLNASRALSGYLIASSGETLVFSALANDIPSGGEGAATSAIDAALLAVAAAN